MVSELHQWPEAVAQSPRGEQNNATVGHINRLSQEVAKEQEILRRRRLADPERSLPLQSTTEAMRRRRTRPFPPTRM